MLNSGSVISKSLFVPPFWVVTGSDNEVETVEADTEDVFEL
jgi:hypothetical protein